MTNDEKNWEDQSDVVNGLCARRLGSFLLIIVSSTGHFSTQKIKWTPSSGNVIGDRSSGLGEQSTTRKPHPP